uniref:Uncharacterized protein n=1 Tax=Ditylenchus dipsaci TaxID=166011 RepID=A0A915DMD0_9BILA
MFHDLMCPLLRHILDFQAPIDQPCKNLTKCRPLPVFPQFYFDLRLHSAPYFADEGSKSQAGLSPPAGLLVRTWLSLNSLLSQR